MKNENWNSIIKSKDFSNYLNNQELIQLSMSSKKTKSYYSNDVVKYFNFSPFVDPRGYKSVVIAEKNNNYGDLHYHLSNPYLPLTSDLIESKNQFVQDIQVFNKRLKKIVVHNSIDYSYLLYELPAIFPDVTTLIITNSVLTIELLQYLLNNFKYLENLDICENILIHNNENINDYAIEWPDSLTNLKLCDNMTINVEDSFNNTIVRQINYSNSGTYDFYPAPKHSPSLINLEYKMPYSYLNNENNPLQFFYLNTQLKELKLSGPVFRYEILNIIKIYENLTCLEYNCEFNDEYIGEYVDEDIDEYNIPVLPNVNHLRILADFVGDYPLRDIFPNVIDLVIQYGSTSYHCDLQSIIINFPKLNSLKLILSDNFKENFNLNLHNIVYLEKLEFNLNYEEAKLGDIKWDIGDCSRLKSFTLTKDDCYTPFDINEINNELHKNWKLYYFPYKLSFIKNSK